MTVTPIGTTEGPVPAKLRSESLEALEAADRVLLAELRRLLREVFGEVIDQIEAFKDQGVLVAAVSANEFDQFEANWADGVERRILPLIGQIFRNAAKVAYDLLAPDPDDAFSVAQETAREYETTVRTNLVSGVGARLWERLRKSLGEGLVAGESTDELAGRVKLATGFAQARLEVIARTEARAARNGGAMLGARALQEFAPAYKQWVATNDSRTRESHREADGQIVPLDSQFIVGGVYMDHPGDNNAPASEVVNCRCRWIAVDAPAVRAKKINVLSDASTRSALTASLAPILVRTDVQEFEQRRGKGGKFVSGGRSGKTSTRNPATKAPGPSKPSGRGRGAPKDDGKPYASAAEHAAAKRQARAKVRNAPVPSRADVEKNRARAAEALETRRRQIAETGKSTVRPSGLKQKGEDIRNQRRALFREFGGEDKGYVVDHNTGLKMHHTDDPAENPNGYPKFERGKIFTGHQGGRYVLANLLPESFETNRSRGDKPIRKENLD